MSERSTPVWSGSPLIVIRLIGEVDERNASGRILASRAMFPSQLVIDPHRDQSWIAGGSTVTAAAKE